MAIQNTLVSNGYTLVYSSTGSNAITSIIVCNLSQFDELNPTSNTFLFALYAVPAADAAGGPSYGVIPTHTIVNYLPITAGETLSLDQEKLVLGDGDLLVARSDVADQLTITVSTLPV